MNILTEQQWNLSIVLGFVKCLTGELKNIFLINLKALESDQLIRSHDAEIDLGEGTKRINPRKEDAEPT